MKPASRCDLFAPRCDPRQNFGESTGVADRSGDCDEDSGDFGGGDNCSGDSKGDDGGSGEFDGGINGANDFTVRFTRSVIITFRVRVISPSPESPDPTLSPASESPEESSPTPESPESSSALP